MNAPTTSPIDLTDLPNHLDPHHHINTIANKLELDSETVHTAHTIVENTPIKATTGKIPSGIAAGAVYLATPDTYRQTDIANAARVSVNTIRLRSQTLQTPTGDEQ